MRLPLGGNSSLLRITTTLFTEQIGKRPSFQRVLNKEHSGGFSKNGGTFSICCDCFGDPGIRKERAASLDLSFFIHWRGTRQEGDPLLTSLSLDVKRRQGGGENAAIARDGKETDRRFLRKFVHFSSFGEFGEWFHVPEPLASRNFTIKLASES